LAEVRAALLSGRKRGMGLNAADSLIEFVYQARDVLRRIVTGDESWYFRFEPVTK
jgi:hypothetical protein